jgi:DNA-binding NtrC family response regulator
MNKNKYFKIVVVDDEVEYQNVVSLILEEEGYAVHKCQDGMETVKYINDNNVDLIITDLRMPVMDGFELIDKIREVSPETKIVVMTAYASVESAISAMKSGADDYYIKSNNLLELIMIVNRIYDMTKLQKRASVLIKQRDGGDIFLDSKNEEYIKVIEMCNRTANTDINILLLGESGVGKEVIANYIHRLSDRYKEPFVPVNCQTFSEGTIESELFGHEKGSFTGAIERRIGRFEEANYGTVFLDEIGDLPMATQGKLLRTIESKSIERVGSNKIIDLDLRFISATNKDLNMLIDDGIFREDLLYRINTLTINIPPLRERKEDIKGLIEYFIGMIEIDQKKRVKLIDEDVMEFLLEYDYPGNIRELKNILERTIALSRDGRITINELIVPTNNSRYVKEKILKKMGDETLRQARAEFEKEYISETLKNNRNNMDKSADVLGITKRQLWNKLNQYEIKH